VYITTKVDLILYVEIRKEHKDRVHLIMVIYN